MEIDKNYILASLKNSIIESPKKIRYRNNILFSIGLDENQEIEVGPLLKSGIVKPARTNLLISELGVEVCECMREYLRYHTNIPITCKINKIGLWRHIQIRENSEKEYLINLRLTNYDIYCDKLESEKYKLINYLEVNVVYKLIQINYQKIIERREPTVNDSLYNFYLKKNLYQKMLGKTFIISPLCFYQINYSTAELMFSKVIELFTKFKKYDILLDLCCGIGVYSFILQDKFNKIIGIDSNPNNIKTALQLKNYNPSHNITFIENKIENILPSLLPSFNNKNITIIVNPVRSGLHINVTNTIKYYLPKINQIIYISCNPISLVRDLKLLDIKKNNIKDIIPINQFPNTKHLEFIINIFP